MAITLVQQCPLALVFPLYHTVTFLSMCAISHQELSSLWVAVLPGLSGSIRWPALQRTVLWKSLREQ